MVWIAPFANETSVRMKDLMSFNLFIETGLTIEQAKNLTFQREITKADWKWHEKEETEVSKGKTEKNGEWITAYTVQGKFQIQNAS